MNFRSFLTLLAFFGQTYCSDESEDFRIISGRTASTLEFPFMAEILKRGLHWCGGSIIHESFILTAAHCFFKKRNQEPASLFKILVGNDERLVGGTEYKVSQVIVHKKYDNEAAMDQYDITLVKLEQPISFNERVQKVNLASVTPQPGEMGWVIGFGRTSPKKIVAEKHLMAVELPVVDLETCKSIVPLVADDMICAGKTKGTGDACQGDSGGPYVIGENLVGIIVWGIGCGKEGMPGVYTNVAHYRQWIESKIKKHSH